MVERRRFLAPEVVQTSPMDCGPAALKCLLEGFGVGVAYGRLREAVQTEVDGTSIDALAETARSLGLDATQILVPVDHVAHALSRTLPAIAVVRLPTGANHFVVVWRRVGSFVQVMDPAAGRIWIRIEDLRRQLYVHGTALSASKWRHFASTPNALAILAHEIESLGHRGAEALVAEAARDETARSLAGLEAAMRMTRALTQSGSIARGGDASALLESLYERARTEDPASHSAIPPLYWTARPFAPEPGGEQRLFVQGALLVRVRGKLDAAQRSARPLSPELTAAIRESAPNPLRAILREITPRERRTAGVFAVLIGVASCAVLAQALVFQALFTIGARFSVDEQRLGVVAALLAFSLGVFLLELPIGELVLRLGRHVDARWRAAFQAKIPLLPERWFASRPSSDMAERAHGLSVLRGLPGLVAHVLRTFLQLVLTASAMIWLDPAAWPWIVAGALCACIVPFALQPALHERELCLRNHNGALARFYLETLLGLVAVRVHGAERKIRVEHEGLLVEWLRAGIRLARATLASRATSSLVGFATAVVLVVEHCTRHPADPGSLLFAYWALSMPALGDQFTQVALQLPAMRNAMLRALEPISAPRDLTPDAAQSAHAEIEEALEPALVLKAAGIGPEAPAPALRSLNATLRLERGLSIQLSQLDLKLGGHPVLEGIELAIRPGEHVALVGRSGAGKSSLIALLLGLHRPSHGRVAFDGDAIDARSLASLRRAIAWVDPAAQIWNDTLFDNLVYGVGHAGGDELASVIADADLRRVLESLPDGLSTELGEGGGFLSGGEGQRVRLARALLRPGVRLALLDEPFRGLDRGSRHALLARAREHWRDATLVCATHDLDETLGFDRVIVLERGRVVADGSPRDLARGTGVYAELVAAEREVRALWSSTSWTRWRVDAGRLRVEEPA